MLSPLAYVLNGFTYDCQIILWAYRVLIALLAYSVGKNLKRGKNRGLSKIWRRCIVLTTPQMNYLDLLQGLPLVRRG